MSNPTNNPELDVLAAHTQLSEELDNPENSPSPVISTLVSLPIPLDDDDEYDDDPDWDDDGDDDDDDDYVDDEDDEEPPF